MPPKQSAARGRGRPVTSKTPSAANSKSASTADGKRGGPSNAATAVGRKDKPAQSRGKQRQQVQQDDDDEAGREVVDLAGHDDDDDDDDDDALGGEMDVEDEDADEGAEEEEEEERQTIPPELLTRILHEFFEREETRITRDANAAVASYVDVFVREAIARAAVERGREGGFLEVEDLEKIAPQLLMDL
ncbi:Centromere protein X [Madurella fahalii]|uniref:Centromere protein X n=1 Tax=Madurella fahalii TaxID=1157608 RepID=A0ABQ0G4W0_9PEZI